MCCSIEFFDEMIKKIVVTMGVLFLFTGCTRFSSKQEPAPVYGQVDSADRVVSKKKSPVTTETTLKVVQDSVILKQQEVTIKPKPQSKTKSSHVVVALLSDADMSYQQGNLNESVATIERALRIEPRNALLLYKLAVIRLQQDQPALAENLAKKSALLAEGNSQLKKKNWRLIAEARELQNNQKGANAALKKAQQYNSGGW